MTFLKRRSSAESIQPYSLRDPHQRKRTTDDWISIVAGIGLAIGLVATSWLLISDAYVRPRLAFDKANWYATFEVNGECKLGVPAKADCPASTDYKPLWQSELRRSSKPFVDRFKSSRNEAFWLGLKVGPADLKLAAKASAQTLVLPKINGVVQVWIDGIYQQTHDFNLQRMPLAIELSKSRLLDGHELVVALGVFPYPHQPVPETSFGSEASDGFYTAVDADRLTRSVVFMSTSQHLIAVGLFLIVGWFLWSVSSSGRTRDFSVGTQLALLIALISLLSVDISFRIFSVALYESIYFSLLLIEVILVLRFTWTILKGSRGTTKVEVLTLLGCLLVPTVFNFYGWIESIGVAAMTTWVLPLTYFACAVALSNRLFGILQRHSVSSKIRRHFLALSAISTGLTAIAYFIEAHHQSGFHVIWSRWLNFIMLFGLVRVFTKSYQTKSSLIELSPSSSYHKLEIIPKQVDGWLVSLHVLKFSRDRQVMSTILSHLWTITQLNDGVVLKADEGSLLILFGATPEGFENHRLVKALADMAKCMKDLETRLPIVFSSQSHSTSILFRAAALKGSIQPAFHSGETGSSRIPIWVDLDGHGSMKEAQTLLATDLDGAIRSNDTSIVVMTSMDADVLVQSGVVLPQPEVSESPLHGSVSVFIAARMAAGAAKKKAV